MDTFWPLSDHVNIKIGPLASKIPRMTPSSLILDVMKLDGDLEELDFEVENSDLDIEIPEMDVKSPDMDVKRPDMDVTNPDMDVKRDKTMTGNRWYLAGGNFSILSDASLDRTINSLHRLPDGPDDPTE